ncbi:MAG: redox-regulated ATPase YchF [bacterium]
MPLSIGIVGLPNVGKSTLFNTLTKKQAPAENYPFCTIEPNIGLVEVPDERLEKLAAISNPAKIVPTIIEFVDIAGLVKGASEGEGLGNKFLSHIRECDAICEVVRDFKDSNIIHVDNKVDPESDRSTINLELILSDLATISKRIDRVVREAKTGDKKIIIYKELLERIKKELENEISARDINLTTEEKLALKDLNLLTMKPIIYVLNIDEQDNDEIQESENLIKINAKLELDIATLPEEEQADYIKELGLKQTGLDKLIKASYHLLGLVSFFTTGPIETKAWTVIKNTPANIASGVIHTDFIKNFIRAEIINWQDFVQAGGEVKAKEKGLVRTEGKEYLIKDGDVCHFLINK